VFKINQANVGNMYEIAFIIIPFPKMWENLQHLLYCNKWKSTNYNWKSTL